MTGLSLGDFFARLDFFQHPLPQPLAPSARGAFNSHIWWLRADYVATGVRLRLSVCSTALGGGCGTSEGFVGNGWRLRPPVAPRLHF